MALQLKVLETHALNWLDCKQTQPKFSGVNSLINMNERSLNADFIEWYGDITITQPQFPITNQDQWGSMCHRTAIWSAVWMNTWLYLYRNYFLYALVLLKQDIWSYSWIHIELTASMTVWRTYNQQCSAFLKDVTRCVPYLFSYFAADQQAFCRKVANRTENRIAVLFSFPQTLPFF